MREEDPDLPSLRMMKVGNEDGLVELMTRYRQPLYRFIYRYVGNDADASEITEKTFLRVFEKAGSFRPRAKVKTWVYTIASNLCYDHIRKEKRRPILQSLNELLGNSQNSSRLERISGYSPSPEKEAETEETLAAIQQTLNDLPHKLKFPFVYCVLENHSQQECAEILGVGVKTVETRIYRARKQLASQLSSLRVHTRG